MQDSKSRVHALSGKVSSIRTSAVAEDETGFQASKVRETPE